MSHRTEDADVIVVGAGPGGSATAQALAQAGLDVLLLEKTAFPREKVCGDGLTPRAVKTLVDMGIDTSEANGFIRNRGLRISAAATGSSCPGRSWPASPTTAWSGRAWTSTSCSSGTPRRPARGCRSSPPSPGRCSTPRAGWSA